MTSEPYVPLPAASEHPGARPGDYCHCGRPLPCGWHAEARPFPKAAQVPPRKPRRTMASRARVAEIRAKKVDGQPCRVCGTLERVTAHHLIPRSLGGEWTESNIVALCGSGTTGCHGDVERHHRDALEKLRLALTEAEYSYVVEHAGEGFLDRYYPVPRETFGRVA